MKKDYSEQKRELIRLSRVARISGGFSILVGFFVLFLLIVIASEEGMNIVVLLVSSFIGYGWYKSVQMFHMSKDMLQFESFEEYVKHVEEQSRKNDEDLF